jgi:hypothetical protein
VELDDDTQDKILGLAGIRVVCERIGERRLPDELQPPDMPEDRGHPWPETIQRLVFELPRLKETLEAGGLLTVTFSDCVDRTWFARYAEFRPERWTWDIKAVCSAMDIRQTWTEVRRIRLPACARTFRNYYSFEFVRQRETAKRNLSSALALLYRGLKARTDLHGSWWKN